MIERILSAIIVALFLGAGLLFAMGEPVQDRAPEYKLVQCFVYLPAMQDARLRRWCLQQSRKLP